MIERSHHDMGGQPGSRVEPVEHDYNDWERRIDAMAVLLWGLKGTKKLLTVDEHRKAIESLPPAAYDSLAYYEKWIVSLAQCLVQRGVVTSAELAQKMQDVMFLRQHHDMGGRPAGKVAPTEHDYAEWERRVDALSVVLGSRKIHGGRAPPRDRVAAARRVRRHELLRALDLGAGADADPARRHHDRRAGAQDE